MGDATLTSVTERRVFQIHDGDASLKPFHRTSALSTCLRNHFSSVNSRSTTSPDDSATGYMKINRGESQQDFR